MNSGLPPLEDLLTRLRDLQLPVTTTTAPGLTGTEMAALLYHFRCNCQRKWYIIITGVMARYRSIHSTDHDVFYWVKQRLVARKTP